MLLNRPQNLIIYLVLWCIMLFKNIFLKKKTSKYFLFLKSAYQNTKIYQFNFF